MRSLLLLFLITLTSLANAKTYYVSNSGSDSNNGTSTSTPWKTVSKVSSFTGFVAGDQVLFNRGEIFYGKLIINNNGSSGNPITFGAYGTGAKPIITGFTTVSSWTNLGSNIWESSGAVSSLLSCNMVTINGKNTAMGRYPNTPTGYLAVQSHNGTTSVTNSALTGTPNWTGATVVIRTFHWTLDTGTVKSQSGSTLNYSAGVYAPADGFGFFLQNSASTLDVQNEWYYNPSTKKIRIYSTTTPSNVQVATLDILAYVRLHNYINIDNISFQGANSSGIMLSSSSNSAVTNCDFSFIVSEGVGIDNGSLNADIENNTFSDCNSSAIGSYDLANSNSIIKYNTISRTGLIPGQTRQNTLSYGAIHINGGNSLIQYNRVDSSGYAGIIFRGTNSKVINNFVTNSALIKDDVGGIYTSSTETGKVIDGNIVLNTIGNANGTGDNQPLAYGIYLDDNATYVTVTNNTVSASTNAGLFLHSPNHITAANNTIYDSKGVGFGKGSVEITADVSGAVRNNLFKHNIFFAKDATQYCFFNYNTTSTADAILYGTSDSNYYAKPMGDANVIVLRQPVSPNYIYYGISAWHSLTGQDVHSLPTPKTVTTVNDLRLEYNATSSNKTVTLDGNYIDVKNVSYNGTITLAPYSSAVLIRNGAATNQSPTANAGSDQSITLPTSSVTLSGSGTDPDGTISSYVWIKISGPSSGTITNSSAASTSITGLTQGTYQFQLKVTDNSSATDFDTVQITVNPAANIPPTANAGSDQSITLPINSITLSGSGADTDGTITSYAWTKISGPSSGTITNSGSASTAVTGLTQGTYQFQLTVTDNKGATGLAIMQVIVNPAANVPPTANAGSDQSITLPTNSVTLSGSGSDVDGTISSYAWAKISGPSSGTITNSSAASTGVTGLTQGTYQFQLIVTDNKGATGSATIQVIVNPAANIPPTANAGSDQSITLPTNSVTLSGSGTDADGTITSYAWIKTSGPSSGTITNSGAASTSVTGLTQGTYQFKLTVTDNKGATNSATVQVTVNPAANIPPTANAGSDQSITLPTNSVTLSGSGSDVDGTISSYAWTKISGPSSGTITNSGVASTSVTGLTQGTYQFQLTVTDNKGATGSATMQVTVNATANIPPTADAGSDQSITLPINSITLSGNGIDIDGTIASYAWAKISGPSSGTITNSGVASTSVTGLTQGTYQFQLTVTDNQGATGTATIQVIVNVNIKPTADAGANQSITLPTNVVTLSGSGTDADGTIASYTWTKISGPSAGSITDASSASTTVTGLVQGTYQFQFTVKDNRGAAGSATMQVIVNPAANIPPVADAGQDEKIDLPTNSASLAGTGTDADGTVRNFKWAKISGANVTIVSPNSRTTPVMGFSEGTYKFQLTVTDNKGAIGKDTVQILVTKGTLPLNLLSFDGKMSNGKVSLVWKTANEKNVLGFEIERMVGSSWSQIGYMQSASASLAENDYTFSDNLPSDGLNYYRLKILDADGKYVYSDIIKFEVKADKNVVYQNIPNPFSTSTTIRYDIAQKALVQIIVYNSLGIQVAALANEIKEPGSYQVQWNAGTLPSGNYFYKVIIGSNATTKTMVKIK